jgi:hypothetical protein
MIGSPRPICDVAAVSSTLWPPSSYAATWNDTRVRVDAFSKTSATVIPARLSWRTRPRSALS